MKNGKSVIQLQVIGRLFLTRDNETQLNFMRIKVSIKERNNQLTTAITESEAIAKVINKFVLKASDRSLKEIFARPDRRLSMLKGRGWNVYLVFEEDENTFFLGNTIIYEVDEQGQVEVFPSL